MSDPFRLNAADGSVPLSWRVLLAEVLADAERHGLGTFTPGFVATPGMNDQAADFIGARCTFLAHKLDEEWSVGRE